MRKEKKYEESKDKHLNIQTNGLLSLDYLLTRDFDFANGFLRFEEYKYAQRTDFVAGSRSADRSSDPAISHKF
jgi:hypothetical protein